MLYIYLVFVSIVLFTSSAEMEPENSINVLMAGMLQTEPSPHIMFAAVSDGDAKIVSEVLRRWPHTVSLGPG